MSGQSDGKKGGIKKIMINYINKYYMYTCTTKLINEKEMIWRITYLNNLGTFIRVQHVDGAFLGMYERTVTPVKIFFTLKQAVTP